MRTKLTVFGKTIEANAPQSFGFNPTDGLVDDLDRADVVLEFSLNAANVPVCYARPKPGVDETPAPIYRGDYGNEHRPDIAANIFRLWMDVQSPYLIWNKMEFAGATSEEEAIVLFMGRFCIDKRVERQDALMHCVFELRDSRTDWQTGTGWLTRVVEKAASRRLLQDLLRSSPDSGKTRFVDLPKK